MSQSPLPLIPQPGFIEQSPGRSTVSEITLKTTTNSELGPEGYELVVTPESITIASATAAGEFYGRVTLGQLRDKDGSLPCVRIVDQPRFAWRHLMIDTARHFFTKQELLHYLDVMAEHKFNIFHWHLNDTQAWRLEIKRYPKLCSIGAWREKIEWGLDPNSTRAWNDKGQYGGFYTQDDVREIVAHAAKLHIKVLPEIEMPGHSRGGLLAHPEFSCNGTGQSGVYCAGNEGTFEFLEHILDEVFELFPSEFIHIGADEVPKEPWKECPKCQARMKSEGLATEDELQSYFVRRMEKYLNAHGRRLVGWDEILEGGLAPNATVMSWRGMGGGIAAAKAGHDVVMTPTSHCYFDLYQAKEGQPLALGGYVPLETVYQFEPVSDEIPANQRHHVLGGGGNLWTEFIPNYGHLMYMTYPRACALAETLWSPTQTRDWQSFKKRLATHSERLHKMGVLYARTIA
jgi:hexosaminidase